MAVVSGSLGGTIKFLLLLFYFFTSKLLDDLLMDLFAETLKVWLLILNLVNYHKSIIYFPSPTITIQISKAFLR